MTSGANPLQIFLDRFNQDEFAAMDLLQDSGIVSDLCVMPQDVARADCERAVEFLKAATTPKQKKTK